jgi:tetratricopeptide (TPR) repeat protein
MYLVPFLLGEAAMRRGDAATSVAQLRKALELNPNFDQAMTGLARALHASGADGEAREWLRKALAINPQNFGAWYQLASLDLRSDPAAAQQAIEKTLAIQPNFAFAHRDLGILAINAQDYPAAAQHLARAAELGLNEAPLFNLLGLAYSKTEREQQAIESYRKALTLDPNLAEAHLNLAALLRRMGRQREAQPEYEAACRLRPGFCQYVPGR